MGYVAVDETRRAFFDEEALKSLDFILCGPEGSRFVIDIKGRRFPTGQPGKPPAGLGMLVGSRRRREPAKVGRRLLGSDYRGLLVFAYHILPEIDLPEDTVDLWEWQSKRYLFRAIPVGEYRLHMKERSPKWETVTLPSSTFRAIVRPLSEYLEAVPELEECPF